MEIEYLGMLAGTLTTIAFVPQVIQTWKTKSADGLSFGMLIIFNLGVFLWFCYGIMQNDAPLMITNGVVIFLALLLLYFKIRFTKNKPT
ncbi:MAG: SemiSWEET family sugar transporter [Saprospiraceae bacterium]|nr:SemiSWEET family sugar transporter [Saprospiraceae bacterium]